MQINAEKIVRAAILALLLFALVCGVLPPLFRRMESGTGALPSASGAVRVRSLDDNTDALCWRLRHIETAQEDIVLSTFAFLDDESGQDIMAALYHAAARGVRVRILVDGLDGQQHLPDSAAFQALLSCETAEARFYNPLSIRLWQINYRMHDKYLIADDTAYILGGRNTKDLSLAAGGNLDRDVLVCEGGADEPGTLAQLRHILRRFGRFRCANRRAAPAARRNRMCLRHAMKRCRCDSQRCLRRWIGWRRPCPATA
ncbi:MAG: phospholipase D-like domain-containing protein [Oscillospiraceae bacterium]|nr:phospholipase D-like domain-containing protein [Oscillospiraceae bacterium]